MPRCEAPVWRVNLPLERSTLSTLAQARLHQSHRSIRRPRAASRDSPSGERNRERKTALRFDRAHVFLVHRSWRFGQSLKKQRARKEQHEKILSKKEDFCDRCNVSYHEARLIDRPSRRLCRKSVTLTSVRITDNGCEHQVSGLDYRSRSSCVVSRVFSCQENSISMCAREENNPGEIMELVLWERQLNRTW